MEDQRTGFGTMVYPDGAEFSGIWENGVHKEFRQEYFFLTQLKSLNMFRVSRDSPPTTTTARTSPPTVTVTTTPLHTTTTEATETTTMRRRRKKKKVVKGKGKRIR